MDGDDSDIVTEEFRAHLVSSRLHVNPCTWILTKSIISRVLPQLKEDVSSAEKVSVLYACLWISSKYEDVYPFSSRKLVSSAKLSRFSFGQSDLCKVETQVCDMLDWRVACRDGISLSEMASGSQRLRCDNTRSQQERDWTINPCRECQQGSA